MNPVTTAGLSKRIDVAPPARSLARDSRTMAIGTAASRLTGFLRIFMLVAVLGVGGVRQGFEVANTLPNSLYELLLGGILTSTLVPLLVRARARGEDEAYTQRLLSLLLLALTALTALAMVTAPQLVRWYSTSTDPGQLDLSVAWARFFLPQILFYGVSATVGAILNTRGRFAAPVWAPVLNNVVVIATLAAFILTPGPRVPEPLTLTSAQLLVLGIGTTLGVVAMTAALLPSLHASGFRWRLRWDFRGMGLAEIGRLAAWTVVYVAAVQAGFLVLTRLATAVGQLPQYVIAFTVWQLPYAVVAVSIITALLPRMSRHVVDGRPDLIRHDLDRGQRLTAVVLIPAALMFVVLGRQVAVTLFAHGATTYGQAEQIGVVLGVLAIGLLPFSIYQLQSRMFYAMADTRTPALIQVLVSTVLIVVDVSASALLPDDLRMYGLAAGLVVANCVGAAVTTVLVRRKLAEAKATEESEANAEADTEADTEAAKADGGGPVTPPPIAGALGRMLVAGLTGAAAAAGVALALTPAVPRDWIGAALVLAVASLADLVVYAGALTLLKVDEARAAIATLTHRAA
jgi:putative peptidoglycan lipid II flippase